MKKLFLLAAFLGSATLLASCGGGGGGDAPQVASADARVAIDAANGRRAFTSLAGESFVFTNGVPAFGTTTATTVNVMAPAAGSQRPRFTIASGGDTASGNMTFGSCRFNVTASTFDPPSTLVAGTTITIDDCELILDTSGQLADGVSVDVSAMLSLDGTNSTGTLVSVAITADGRILLDGRAVGTVTLRPATGATGAG